MYVTTHKIRGLSTETLAYQNRKSTASKLHSPAQQIGTLADDADRFRLAKAPQWGNLALAAQAPRASMTDDGWPSAASSQAAGKTPYTQCHPP